MSTRPSSARGPPDSSSFVPWPPGSDLQALACAGPPVSRDFPLLREQPPRPMLSSRKPSQGRWASRGDTQLAGLPSGLIGGSRGLHTGQAWSQLPVALRATCPALCRAGPCPLRPGKHGQCPCRGVLRLRADPGKGQESGGPGGVGVCLRGSALLGLWALGHWSHGSALYAAVH